MKYKQDLGQKEKEEEEFLKWLSPSYWLVEAQLHSVRQQRGENTLKWARDMEEFRDWRLARLDDVSSLDRILWIRGPLGIGKSTMAGYFIDLLKRHYPSSIVAYFFCRSNQAGLTKARDIVRTLAYQCNADYDRARSMLESLRKKKFPIEDELGLSFLFEKLLSEPLGTTQKDTFIVLDGLDEADLTTPDDSPDRAAWPAMKILLKCLPNSHSPVCYSLAGQVQTSPT